MSKRINFRMSGERVPFALLVMAILAMACNPMSDVQWTYDDIEQADVGPDIEQADVGPDIEQADVGPDIEQADVGSDIEQADVGSDIEPNDPCEENVFLYGEEEPTGSIQFSRSSGVLENQRYINSEGVLEGILEFEYSHEGILLLEKWYISDNDFPSKFKEYSYDNEGRLISRKEGNIEDGELLASSNKIFSYGIGGVLSTETIQHFISGLWKNGVLTTHYYSLEGRRIESWVERIETGSLDHISYVYVDGDLVEKTTDRDYVYGETSPDEKCTYEYDLGNLTREVYDSLGGQFVTTWTFDEFGRLANKFIERPVGPKEHRYLYLCE
jgi:hypothetical protein